MRCEFEEKTFEQYFNIELSKKAQFIFPLGQCTEGYIGVDAIFGLGKNEFWEIWPEFWRSPIFNWPLGIIADNKFWKTFGKLINEQYFHQFKFNLFIQYKRPEYITPRTKCCWNQPYYKYYINKKQQKILEQLENYIDVDGLVIYACPCFYKYKSLFDYQKKSILIENTNYAQPIKINDHNKYTFIKPGRRGKAFSNPEEIESYDFMKKIDKLFLTKYEYESNTSFIKKLWSEIVKPTIDKNQYYKKMFNNLKETIAFPEAEFGKSYISINLFCMIINLNWMIGFAIE